MVAIPVLGVRIGVIAASLGLWFWSQKMLGKRAIVATDLDSPGAICDGIHNLTAPIHKRLIDNPRLANLLLASSSGVIDVLGFYLLFSAIFGATFQSFIGLFILFALRQVCQAMCPLPCPQGMIWRSPGVPTVLVTYGTCNDLFFSGHTAIAVYGAVTLAAALGHLGIALGAAIMIFEIGTVLVLRAHYSMDVFAGAITALYVHRLSIDWAPTINDWINHAAALFAR